MNDKVLVLFLLVCTLSLVHSKLRIVDLSHLHNSESIMWPGYPDYEFTIAYRGPFGSVIPWVEFNTIFQTEHMGTHMDAPAHFGKGKWRTQQIPIERLIGPGVIINIKNKAARNPDYQVVMEDIHAYESRYGRIKEGSIVLMYAGWYQKYPNKTAIFNTEHHNITSEFHFPGFHEDTVEWLIHHRRISAIGCDTPTFELPQTSSFPVHQIIGRENVIGIENAAYLDKIPEAGSTIFMPVIKIDDGSGGPVRLLATYEDGIDTPANGAETFFERSSLKFAFILIFVFKKITVFNC